MSDPKLKRALGLADVTLYFVTACSSLQWVATAAASGPSALTVWLLGALTMFAPLSICTVWLASRHPDEGGLYVWSGRAFGPFAAFLTGWTYYTREPALPCRDALLRGEQRAVGHRRRPPCAGKLPRLVHLVCSGGPGGGDAAQRPRAWHRQVAEQRRRGGALRGDRAAPGARPAGLATVRLCQPHDRECAASAPQPQRSDFLGGDRVRLRGAGIGEPDGCGDPQSAPHGAARARARRTTDPAGLCRRHVLGVSRRAVPGPQRHEWRDAGRRTASAATSGSPGSPPSQPSWW